MSLQRIDTLLAERKLAPSRVKAREMILSGGVFCNGKQCDKPSMLADTNAKITLKTEPLRFVSRAGEKLDYALTNYPIDTEGLTAFDIGASAGGFTDCLLQRGVKKVYAVDVGHGQLHEKLRNDERVISLEGVNARFLSPEVFSEEKAQICTVDVSFISLTLVLHSIITCLTPKAKLITLVKPQFEAGRGYVGKNGIVKDPAVHKRVCSDFRDFCRSAGLSVLWEAPSPIPGGDGNIEFLFITEVP